IGEIQAARQLDGREAQCRLDRHRLLGGDNAMGDPALGEYACGVLRRSELFLGAKDLKPPAGPVIEGDARLRAQVLETRFAVVRDALHARLVAGEALRSAVAQELEEPSPLIGIEPRTPDDRCVMREQAARDVT